MASLYELSAGYASFIDAYDTVETDQEREEILEMLAKAEGDIADKAEAYARIIRNKSAEADAFKAEADRLTARRRAAENLVNRLKSALKDAMVLVGTEEISTSIGKWRIQANPLSCEVMDIDQVPMEYHIKVPDAINKKALLDYYKATGEIVPGCEFHRGQSIRFR